MLLATAWMLAVPAQAACNDGTGGPNGVVFANGGSTCHATLGSYSGANVGHALGDGSVLIFDQNVTLSSGVANAQVLGVGGANGLGSSPAAIVHATGDLTAVASNSTSGSVTRPVYIYAGSNGSGTRSLLQVDGNLTATTQGGQGAALENAGGDIWVQGTTTLTTRVADAWRNNGGVGIFDGPVNLAVGVGGAGAGLRMSSGTLTFNSTFQSATSAGSAVIVSGGTVDARSTATLSTQGASATALALSGTGEFSTQGGSVSTAGALALGISASGASRFVSSGGLDIRTAGNGGHGIQLSGTGKATLAGTSITTQGTDAHGVDLVNTAAQGTTLALNGPLFIETQGAGSSGIRSVYNMANAVVVPVGSSILTHGDNANGLDLRAPSGDLSAWNVASGARIETQGVTAQAVYLSSTDGKVSFGSAGELVASGKGSNGIQIGGAPGGADVTNSGSITVGGADGAVGIAGTGLGGDARLVNTGSILQSSGIVGAGAGILATHAGSSGALTLDNQGSIASAGGSLASGIYGSATGGADLRLINAGTIGTAAAPASAGLLGVVTSASATLTAVNSGRIDASLGMSFISDGALDVTNTGVVVDSASAGMSLGGALALGGRVSNSGSLLASSTGVISSATGHIELANSGLLRAPQALRVTAGSIAAINTASGSIHGTVQADGGQIDLNNAGLWTNTGNSVLTSLSNGGTVTFTAPVGGTYKTITTGGYVGGGGLISMNTWLGDDSSPSDRLVIDGGSATGSTRVGITNAGGAGAQTTGNGILIVDAQNGATTAAGAFSLAAPVSAGAYDYSLVRRANESWYLTTDLITPPDPGSPSEPGTPPGTGTPSLPVLPTLPNYRQETSLYAAVPSLAALHSAATMDSFHERMGAAGYAAAGEDSRPARLWVRLIGSNGKRKGDALGVYGRSGPAYDHKTAALQLGGDFYQGRNGDGSRTHAGLYFATGQTSGDVRHFNGTAAGSAKLDVTSLGLYWTLLGAQGGYVDFVAQGSHYGVKATSARMPGVKSSGTGYDVSVEGGLPFSLGGAWTLEPQLQVRRQQADLGGGADLAGRVNYGDVDSLVGRAGLKLGYATPKLAAWARLDLLNEFQGRSTTTVSSLAGLHGVNFDSSVHGRSLALTAGVDARLTQAVSLYGSASYRRALGGSRGHAWGAQAGVKVAW